MARRRLTARPLRDTLPAQFSMINTILIVAQLVLAVILTGSILLQARGTGLSTAFGGEGNVYRTKRGVEKKLFQLSIVSAIFFFGVSLATVIM